MYSFHKIFKFLLWRLFLSCAFTTSTKMTQQNSSITEFILLGLTQDPMKQKMVFVIFFVFYVGTVVGNLLIIVTIKSSQTLGSPMCFFLFYLSLADSCFSTSTAPRLIVDALSAKKIIPYDECMTQVFALHLFGCMEIFVLVLMAVDRYVATCKPLRYPTIRSRQVCIILIILAWIGSFTHSMAQIILALKLPFCGPNLIDHYFCDMQPLLKLACMDMCVINLLLVSNSGRPFAQAVLWFWWSHTLSSYILCETTVQKGGKKLSPLALPTSLQSSYSLVRVYSFTHVPQPLSPWTRWCPYFILLGHPFSTPWSTHWGMQKWKMPWESYGISKLPLFKQKMNCGPWLSTYWVMVWLNLYRSVS